MIGAQLVHWAAAARTRDGGRHDSRLLRVDLMLLTMDELLNDPCDASTILPHGTRELPLVVSAISIDKVLERFVSAAHPNDDLLPNDLAIHYLDTHEEV